MKTFYTYLQPKLAAMSLGLSIKFCGTVIELLLPWMLSVILDTLVPRGDLSPILLWGGLMIVCAVLALVANVMANRMATRTSRDITRRLRHDLFARVTTLSTAQRDAFTAPSLISRLTSDTYNAHQMVDRMQRLGVRAPILLLGGVFITFTMEPVLTLVLLAVLPLLGLMVWFVSRCGVRMYTKTQTALDGLILQAQESMTGIRVIQALGKTSYEQKRFDAANAAEIQCEQRSGLLMNVTNPVMNLLLNAGLTLVIVVGAFRVNSGVTQPGVIIAFLSYFTIILNALMMVSRLFVMYSKGSASVRRITEVLDAPRAMEENALPDAPRGETAPENEMDRPPFVEFRNVTFSYGKLQNDVTEISFSLRRGETLGIIGPTGSGKSTVLRLLLRFYDPDAGTVLLDGHDLRSVSPEVLRCLFGVVFQNDFLYSDTITENIDFGRDLPPERIRAAAKTAQADFIERRIGGFSATLSAKGANLSGGQQQRILLARALAADPPLLLLDDSSSALDYKTDAALRRALVQEYASTTKVIVTQRVSSIRHAEHILVLEDGHAAGYGTHDALMLSCPGYREIAEIQMQEVAD